MQHIEITDVEVVPAIVTISTSAPNETTLSVVETLEAENDFTQYEDSGSEASGYSPDQKLRKRTVLVVDDDQAALEEMIETLKDYDLFVVSAKDAEEALCQANQHKPAYVVMDFKLPKMNGLDAVTSMRKFLPDTNYIMISGCQDFCRVATVKNTKSLAVLQKPITMDGIARFITIQNDKLDCSYQSHTERPAVNFTQNKSSDLVGKHILVVDDEPEITEELAELLGDSGFTVSVASDPVAAIALVKSNEDISVVITDLSMPVMTGLEMIEKIYAELPVDRNISTIVLTGQADTNRAINALRLGASDFLSKPIDPDLLIQATERTIESVRLKYLERAFRVQLQHRVLERTEEVQKLSSHLFNNLSIKNAELEAFNKVTSRLLTLISHELRTPLSAITAFSSLMKVASEQSANSREIEYSKGILDAENKLLSIINTIRELVYVGGGGLKLNKTRFNTSDLINRVVKVLKPKADKAGVEILVQLENAPKFIYGDSHRLTQAIGNIIDNAIRFSAEFRTVVVAASGNENNIIFTIEDQGIGMTEDQLMIAVEPFRQVDSSYSKTVCGMGLGLTLSRLFVELHGGELKILSTYGVGTIVDIQIPWVVDCNE